jgi:sugar (pentulose or hexulose) kinase
MPAENILAIDNGTQSARALLFDPRGNLLAKQQIPFDPYYSTAPGWAEQDPTVFWNAVCEACRGLFAQPGVDKSSIAAVSLTTQRATMINLDREGKPLRPAMSWLDQRRAEGIKPVGGAWGAAFAVAGMRETVEYLQGEAECNWIATRQPEIWSQTYKFVYLSGYLTYMLTGHIIDSVGCQVGYLPFDYKSHTWAKKWDWKWQALDITPDKLTELIPVGGKLGAVTPAASEATGIPAGLPLIAAAADKACEVLGSGCITPDVAAISYGSSATINTTHHKYIEAIPLIPPYPAAEPNAYNLEIQIYRGYWMVNWFLHEFGQREQILADEQGVPPESFFDDLVRIVPPGSDGLVLQPFWSPGVKYPGPEARGAIIGFSAVHTRAHIYRAILEGLAYALRDGLDRSMKRTGVPVTSLHVAGGGSQSSSAMQLTADIFGLPASRPHVYEASGLGAAIVASVGAGIHPDFATAVREMTHLGETFEPDAATHAIYDRLYGEVYEGIYQRLRPLYQAIRSITHEKE